MGVLILALGLLGLGAVIPVVVREQRLASDATLGVSAVNNAEAYLASRPQLNRLTDPERETGGVPDKLGFGVWQLTPTWSTQGKWAKWKAAEEIDAGTGDFRIVDASSGSARAVAISVADRLWPNRSSDGGVPRFIWDIVGRRIDGMNPPTVSGDPTTAIDDHLQLVVFVRRLDSNIRVPRGKSLSDVLTMSSTDKDHRLPVAVDPTTKLPTLNGMGVYAEPIVLGSPSSSDAGMSWDPVRRDRIKLPGADATQFKLASQPGQKLVDTFGNVYTVLGPASDAPTTTIIIDRRVEDWMDKAQAAGNKPGIIFTPQVPAAVTLLRWAPIDPQD